MRTNRARASNFRIVSINSPRRVATRYRREVRFTTWTLKYNRMFWVTVDAMAEHWERARVNAAIDGDAIRATTSGVTALHLAFEPGLSPFAAGATPTLTIDGTTVALARRRARQVAHGGSRPNGRWLEGRRTARDRPSKGPRSAGADRRCVHGCVRVRAADRQALVRSTRDVGARAGRLRHQRVDSLLPRRAAGEERHGHHRR